MKKQKTPLLAIAIIMIVVIILLLVCIGVALRFGVEFTPANWIALAGTVVGFVGSMSLALVNTWQSSKIREDSRLEMEWRQYQDVQPALHIEVPAVSIAGHFDVKLSNYGNHPIFNVVVFDNYCHDVLLPGETKLQPFTFGEVSGKIDPFWQGWSEGTGEPTIFTVGSDEYGVDEEDDCPRRIRIRYCDILGYENMQDFYYISDLGKRYYQGTNILRGNRIHDLLQERIDE